jgi:hypothetical protein
MRGVLVMKVISDRFKVFAKRECKGSSPLYEHLSENIAEDDTLLQIASHARPGQPVPNLFLGAVHYLLLRGKSHELSEYYGSIFNNPREALTAYDSFKDFCLQHENEIIPILESKLVQTNEVRRCAYLYPAFCHIYEKTKKPLALIEIGTSAGLQLLWDKYAYSYHSNEVYGSSLSELQITSEIRGGRQPVLLKHSPPVTSRIGIDLHINDLKDPKDYLWLKSLIWPEHAERNKNFENAARCLKDQSIELIEGDGVKLLYEIASTIPQWSTLCVFHTHVSNQMSQEDKYKLVEQIQRLGEGRNVFHIYNNMWDLNLHLDSYLEQNEYKETIAETDGHGRWFHWKMGLIGGEI